MYSNLSNTTIDCTLYSTVLCTLGGGKPPLASCSLGPAGLDYLLIHGLGWCTVHNVQGVVVHVVMTRLTTITWYQYLLLQCYAVI